ncbi:MAG: CDP-alcohol phosphatidyltransferase family protein [Tidjanibacter sp.]|nr:CDP-alcohol phosphatidyltransferase family protein [Tidjanibacter sp.]
MKRAHIANIITGLRILGAVLLLFFPLFSLGFYITFLLCGVSDMIDGMVARKTNSTSSFGAKFDTAADLVFMAVVCCKLLPSILIPQWLWVWIIIIAVVKVSNIVLGALRRKTLVSVHSVLNKDTTLLFTVQHLDKDGNYGIAIAGTLDGGQKAIVRYDDDSVQGYPFFDYMQFIAEVGSSYYRLTDAELLQLPAAMNPAGGQIAVSPKADKLKEIKPLYTKLHKPARVYKIGGRKFNAVQF